MIAHGKHAPIWPAEATNDAEARKCFEQLRAEAALLDGYALLQLADGSYLITKWNLSRHFADLLGIRQFLRQVGALPG